MQHSWAGTQTHISRSSSFMKGCMLLLCPMAAPPGSKGYFCAASHETSLPQGNYAYIPRTEQLGCSRREYENPT